MLEPLPQSRTVAYGQHGLSWVDRLGVYLSYRRIRRCLSERRRLEVLDCGCGYSAQLLQALTRWVGHGVGIDVSIAPQCESLEGLKFITADLNAALPTLADGQFDLILLISVLEHLCNPGDALRHCYRLLRPDGQLLVNVPTWLGKGFLEFSAFRLGTSPACEMDDHKMYYNKHDLWPLLILAGFKPSRLRLQYHKFGLNLFAQCTK